MLDNTAINRMTHEERLKLINKPLPTFNVVKPCYLIGANSFNKNVLYDDYYLPKEVVQNAKEG